MYPSTDWYAALATAGAFGVTVAASPRGAVTRRAGNLAIGVLSYRNGRVYVTPREGLTDGQNTTLLRHAWWTFINGPVGSCWTRDGVGGMVGTVYVPDQLSVTVSRAMAMSSAVDTPMNPCSGWRWG